MRIPIVAYVLLFFQFNKLLFVVGQDDDAGCQNATPLPINGNPISSTTIGVPTTEGFDITFNQCDGETFDVGSAGVRFTIEGTGDRLKVSTCSATSSSSGHRITLYNGEDCESKLCLDTSIEEDPDCSFPNSSYLEFLTMPGELHFIFVHDQVFGESSDFELTLTGVTDPPSNDSCESPSVLTEREIASGNLLGATEKSEQFACDIESTTSRLEPPKGVWYKILASSLSVSDTTEPISFFMCSESTGLAFSVFSEIPCGSDEVDIKCQETKPVTDFEFYCSLGDEIPVTATWNVTDGVDYSIVVYGTDNSPFRVVFVQSNSDDIDIGGNDADDTSSGGTTGWTSSFLLFCMLLLAISKNNF